MTVRAESLSFIFVKQYTIQDEYKILALSIWGHMQVRKQEYNARLSPPPQHELLFVAILEISTVFVPAVSAPQMMREAAFIANSFKFACFAQPASKKHN